MQRIGVTGIEAKRLLATDLRIENSAGPQMAETGVMKRLKRRGGRTG